MAIYDNLPVFKLSYDLLLQIYRMCTALPRDYRYTIGERLKTETMELLICIYKANGTTEKYTFLAEARERVVVIKLQLRVLHDLKQLSVKQFALMAEQLENISKQLTLWQKK